MKQTFLQFRIGLQVVPRQYVGRVFKMDLPICWPKQAGASLLLGRIVRRNMLPRHASLLRVLAGASGQSHFENTPQLTS